MIATTTLSTYYLPKLTKLESKEEIRKEVGLGYLRILPIVIVSGSIIYYFRKEIILILFTKEFAGMEKMFLFQLLGDFVKIASWLIGVLLSAKALVKTHITTEIIF